LRRILLILRNLSVQRFGEFFFEKTLPEIEAPTVAAVPSKEAKWIRQAKCGTMHALWIINLLFSAV
jgi:hypothetical protein